MIPLIQEEEQEDDESYHYFNQEHEMPEDSLKDDSSISLEAHETLDIY